MSIPGTISDTERAGSPVWVTEGGPLIDRRSRLSVREFHEEYERRNRPVNLTDVLGGWPALGKWSPGFFAGRYGDRTIQFQRGAIAEMRMDEFIGQVDASRPGNPAPYWTNNPLKEIIPELMEGPGGKEKARHREAVPGLGNDRENQQTPEGIQLISGGGGAGRRHRAGPRSWCWKARALP